MELEPPGMQPRDVEHIIDQTHEPPHLFVRRVEDPQETLLGGALASADHRLKLDVHGGDRRLQFVRRDTEELLVHADSLLGLVMEMRVVDGDRGAAGQLLGERQRRRPEGASRIRQPQGDRPQQPVASQQRHGHEAPGTEASDDPDVFVIATVASQPLLRQLTHQEWLARAQHMRRRVGRVPVGRIPFPQFAQKPLLGGRHRGLPGSVGLTKGGGEGGRPRLGAPAGGHCALPTLKARALKLVPLRPLATSLTMEGDKAAGARGEGGGSGGVGTVEGTCNSSTPP